MCSFCRLPVTKNHNFGGSCTDPLLPMRAKFGVLLVSWSLTSLFSTNMAISETKIWCAIADPRHMLTCQISSRSVYSVALWRRKTPIFAIFLTSAFSGVASWQQSEKVEHMCTSTNLCLSNVSKPFLCSNAFVAKSGAQTLTFKSVTDRQTNRQTDKKTLSVFGRPGGGRNPSITRLGMVIEDLKHVLAALKLLGV